jgi:hypothetical protein
MKRIIGWSGIVGLALGLAAPALAQSAGATGQAQVQQAGQAQTKDGAVSASTQSQTQASAEASVASKKAVETIRAKGAKVSAAATAKAEAKLEAAAKSTDQEASASGDAKVASRLAAEFNMTTEQLLAEKSDLQTSWGQLMIAHSLVANSTSDVTVSQLIALHDDGMGWGQIAAGMGLRLGDVVSAAQAESRVAAGLAKADGKVAVIHGPGARAGLGASTNAGLGAGGANAGARVGAQAGAGVQLPKIKP